MSTGGGDLKPCSHRWVQIPKDVYDALISLLPTKPLVCGYKFLNSNSESTPMLKFHVDDHDCLQEYAAELWPEFGGNLSVHCPANPRPLIIFGQDEFIFSQFSFNSRCGACLSASKNNTVNLILRLFLYHFLHTMSLWRHESIHHNTNNQQTPPPWWWSRSPLHRHGFDESTPPEWRAALLMFVPRLLLKGFGRINKLM